jgi:hypothetical protein
MTKVVWCTTTFNFLHHWPEATGSVEYLKWPHRHQMFVKLGLYVKGSNREVEFITVKHELDSYISFKWPHINPNGVPVIYTYSCEHIAEKIAQYFNSLDNLGYHVAEISVSEDGENGATIRFDAPSEYSL